LAVASVGKPGLFSWPGTDDSVRRSGDADRPAPGSGAGVDVEAVEDWFVATGDGSHGFDATTRIPAAPNPTRTSHLRVMLHRFYLPHNGAASRRLGGCMCSASRARA
jgi:hypothetical protein